MTRGVWQRNIVTNEGDVIAGAQIDVVSEATGLPVTLYSDRTGGSNIGNPAFADPNGFIQFYTDPARIRVTASGVAGTQTFRNENIIDIEELFTTANYQPQEIEGLNCRLILQNNSGVSVGAGVTVAGSSVNTVRWDSLMNPLIGGVYSGTYKNITGQSISDTQIGMFVRIA
jgi:hypothetical protein